ncbi:MAG: hypothetical protein ACRD21_25530 [Vicinamibacteria bacterium]
MRLDKLDALDVKVTRPVPSILFGLSIKGRIMGEGLHNGQPGAFLLNPAALNLNKE